MCTTYNTTAVSTSLNKYRVSQKKRRFFGKMAISALKLIQNANVGGVLENYYIYKNIICVYCKYFMFYIVTLSTIEQNMNNQLLLSSYYIINFLQIETCNVFGD